MTKGRVTELEQQIKRYEGLISRKPNNDNAYSQKAEALVELGKITNTQSYNEQALACYNRAIDIAPENALYLIDRSKLYVTIGKPELAVKDIQRVKDLPADTGNWITDSYMENTMRDIAALDEIQTTIKKLHSSGAIPAELANLLASHAGVTANLVVQVGVHGKTLSIHDQDIANLKVIVADLLQGKNISDAQIALLEQKTEGLKSEVSHNTAQIQGIEEKALKIEAKVGQLEDDSAMYEDMIIGMKEDLDMLKPVTAALHEKVKSSSSLSDHAKQEMQGMVSQLEENMKLLTVQGKDQGGIMSKVIARIQNLTEQQDFTQIMLTNLCTDIDGIKDNLPDSTQTEGFVLIGDVTYHAENFV